MEPTDGSLPASRRSVLKTSALGVGALAGLSTVGATTYTVAAEVDSAATTAGDMFLAIDGIPGGSTDAKHKDEIQIESFSWGASNSGTAAHGGGAGAGKVSMQDFHFSAFSSKASPKLFLGTATGQHFKKAVLTVRKSGGDQQEFYKVTLEDCLISSYQSSGSPGGGLPMDSFSLNYAKVEYAFTEQKADGSLGDSVVVTYPPGRG